MEKTHIAIIIRRLLTAITIPILTVAVVLLGYTVQRNYDYNKTTMLKNQEAVLSSVDEHIAAIQSQMLKAAQTMDFLYFSNNRASSIVSSHASAILSNLQSSLAVYKEAVGVFLYNNQLDRTYIRYLSIENKALDFVPSDLPQPLPGRRETELVPILYNGEQCFLYRARQRYAELAVLICPARNSTYRTLCSISDGSLVFTGSAAPANSSTTISSVSNFSHLAIQYQMPSLISFTGLNGFQIAAILVLFFLASLVIVLFYRVQKILLSPILRLSESFREVSGGNTAYRIGTTSNVYEFDQFYSGFDNMLDSLHEAEAEAYRHQSAAEKAQMQYLQMQIRPHFYLNCLKTIHFFAQLHEDDKIQDIVVALSNYFRYSFQDVNRLVTIGEELSSVYNYAELSRLLYSEIRLELDVPEEVMDVPCLPLTVLTFAENCIKHRADADEVLVKISARIETDPDGSTNVCMTVQNNSPFVEEMLEELNAMQPDAFQYKSHRVGIANVRYRMWLLYHGNFRLHFSNQDGLATVALTFPTKPEITPETRRS